MKSTKKSGSTLFSVVVVSQAATNPIVEKISGFPDYSVIPATYSDFRNVESGDETVDLILFDLETGELDISVLEKWKLFTSVPKIFVGKELDKKLHKQLQRFNPDSYLPRDCDANSLQIALNLLVQREKQQVHFSDKYAETRLELIEFAQTHSLSELLTEALDIVGSFVDSPIGFYHFVHEDQKTLSLQQWSTRTLEEFCQAEGRGIHYSIEQAGVWVECVYAGKPVVHNDYKSLKNKKGMPEGHAEVIRELVVPVIRDDKVVAILGVGNKPNDYTQVDVEIVSYLADVTWQIISHKRLGEELLASAEEWQITFDAVNAAIWIIDKEQNIIRTNKVAESLFGKRTSEIIGCKCWDIAHGCQDPISGCPVPRAKKTKQREAMELTFNDEWYEVVVDPILGENREYRGAVHIITNISDRKREEEEREKLRDQLMESQKMEAIGRLAGGIAHDFNNMLSVILGYTELAQKNSTDDVVQEDLNEVFSAAKRSVLLTGQLLAFARRQAARPKVIDINETVAGMLSMLRRLIGEDIDLLWVPGPNIGTVLIDPAQLDQILANLCVNARDAISGVGKVTVQTKSVVIDESYSDSNPEFIPGKYILLGVSDDGSGMEDTVMSNIFEPFFTTKDGEKGTGLGLSTVYGIVRQNGGFIHVYSEPDTGTTFKIYLPESEENLEPAERKSVNEVTGGKETILLVEDEGAILRLGRAILQKFGYSVLTASTPTEAVETVDKYQGDIHLLVTDVVMPEMNGKELVDRIKKLRPELKVLYMSGYTSDVVLHRGILQDNVHFLQKPFSVNSMGKMVRIILDYSE